MRPSSEAPGPHANAVRTALGGVTLVVALLLLVPSAIDGGRGAVQAARVALYDGGSLESWSAATAWLPSARAAGWRVASPVPHARADRGRSDIGLGPVAERRTESQSLAPPRIG